MVRFAHFGRRLCAFSMILRAYAILTLTVERSGWMSGTETFNATIGVLCVGGRREREFFCVVVEEVCPKGAFTTPLPLCLQSLLFFFFRAKKKNFPKDWWLLEEERGESG